MPVKVIYIARHGFRLNWTNSYWTSPTGLERDPPLSAYGETQAKELAAYLVSLPEGERPTAIFTSPYYRCIQTSLPVADALSLPLYVEFGLSEWYSPVTPGTGLHPRPAPADDLLRYFPRPTNVNGSSTGPTKTTSTNAAASESYIDPRWKSTYLVTRKGESVAELYARCEEFLRVFIARVEGLHPFIPSPLTLNPPAAAPGIPPPEEHHSEVGVGHERILLVSHAGTVVGLTRALTGDEGVERSMRVGCCTLTTFHRSSSPVPPSPPSVPSIPAGCPPRSLPSPPPPSALQDVIGKSVWTVHGAPADGSFLSGGIERSWGMVDIATHEGVVVEDPGTPGSEDDEDGPNGVQVLWQTQVPSPKM